MGIRSRQFHVKSQRLQSGRLHQGRGGARDAPGCLRTRDEDQIESREKRDSSLIRDDIMQCCSLSHHAQIYSGPKPIDVSPMSREEPEPEKLSEEGWKEWNYDEHYPDSEADNF